MDPITRFTALVQGPEEAILLDEACLLVAAHAYPELNVAAELARLDELAATCWAPTLDALVRHLFVEQGFAGNTVDYYDPRNSFLNDVLTRRTGIPITLAIVAMEVGRRIGVPLAGVGMPCHFLLRDRVDPQVFVDPFARGALLTERQCVARFHQVHGLEAAFDPEYLDPVGRLAIMARVLGNLKAVYLHHDDKAGLAWVLRLRAEIPGVGPEERRQLASVLASRGAFDQAATELERLGDRPGAAKLRARMN